MRSGSSFSIVTPNYNMAHYLPETIESVLTNLKPGDEYFVVDGGSTDNSVDIIRRYAEHLTWISEKDNGYADALQKGFRQSSGEFMCWINSGDLLLHGALEAARNLLTSTGADLIWGDDVYIDEQSRVIFQSHAGVPSLKRMMLYAGWTPLQDACYWRRSIYDRIGGINPALRYAGDYDFFLRASLSGKCVYVPKVYSAFRRHQGQKSISASNHYEREREECRRRMLRELHVSVPQRLVSEIVFGLMARWRYYVGRRLYRSRIPGGTAASELVVA